MIVYTLEYGCADQTIEVFAGVHKILDEACEDVIERLHQALKDYSVGEDNIQAIFQEVDELDDGLKLVRLLVTTDEDNDPFELEWYRIREYML